MPCTNDPRMIVVEVRQGTLVVDGRGEDEEEDEEDEEDEGGRRRRRRTRKAGN